MERKKAKDLEAQSGDEFRICCPFCETTWTTHSVPQECPECGALVTFCAERARTQPEGE
jgi:rubrerythrin